MMFKYPHNSPDWHPLLYHEHGESGLLGTLSKGRVTASRCVATENQAQTRPPRFTFDSTRRFHRKASQL